MSTTLIYTESMKQKWFTLIEIMIVLLVFSVGVLAVLRLILYNINTMSDLEAKTTATLLAKEWFELAYNTRDSNRLSSLPWNCITNSQYNENLNDSVCVNYFLDNNGIRTIQAKDESIERKSIPSNWFNEAKLFLKSSWTLSYTHEETNQESIFARYIYFTWVKDNEAIINTWYLLKIESHVLYQRWSKTGEIILEWFIWNY